MKKARPTRKKATAPRSTRKTKSSSNALSKTAKRQPASGGEWRGKILARMRALIREADPKVTEERKWKKASTPDGVPVWSHDGMICTGESYKEVVKLTFAKGASLPDPAGLFNSSLEGNTRRAIDIRAGETVNATAFKALVKAAVALNTSTTKKKRA